MTDDQTTSEQFRWLASVRERQARQERIRKLRTELAIARAAGVAARHAEKLRRNRATKRMQEES